MGGATTCECGAFDRRVRVPPAQGTPGPRCGRGADARQGGRGVRPPDRPRADRPEAIRACARGGWPGPRRGSGGRRGRHPSRRVRRVARRAAERPRQRAVRGGRVVAPPGVAARGAGFEDRRRPLAWQACGARGGAGVARSPEPAERARVCPADGRPLSLGQAGQSARGLPHDEAPPGRRARHRARCEFGAAGAGDPASGWRARATGDRATGDRACGRRASAVAIRRARQPDTAPAKDGLGARRQGRATPAARPARRGVARPRAGPVRRGAEGGDRAAWRTRRATRRRGDTRGLRRACGPRRRRAASGAGGGRDARRRWIADRGAAARGYGHARAAGGR